MKTVTLSMRLPRNEVERLAHVATLGGLDRSAFLKRALRRGASEIMLEQAVEMYRRGTVTLSRAAEMAGLELRVFLARMSTVQLELNYSGDDLARDMAP